MRPSRSWNTRTREHAAAAGVKTNSVKQESEHIILRFKQKSSYM